MARRHPVQDLRDPSTRYGFTYGTVDVIRLASLPDGRRVLGIQTDHLDLEVYVSAGGRQVTIRDTTGQAIPGEPIAVVRHG